MKKLFQTLSLISLFLFYWISEIDAQVVRLHPLVIDHHAAAKFQDIPDSVLSNAIQLRLMFRHASVGTTIDDGLDCVQGSRTSPDECTLFPPFKYDRRNWHFQARGNSGWYGKINDFVTEVYLQADSFDILSFKYCYLEGLDQLAEPCGGTPYKDEKIAQAWDSLRLNMEALEAAFPDKIFIWWTIPLTQVGQFCTDTLNTLIRNYVNENNKILFDIADIEAWDTNQKYCTNVQGWEIAFKGYCGEQKPDAQACHPNWLGKLILAKAFWCMMVNLEAEQQPQSLYQQTSVFDFKMFPNPAVNDLNICFYLDQQANVQIMLYDILGKKTDSFVFKSDYSVGEHKIHFNINNLAKGYYILEFIGAKDNIRQKLLVR